MKKQSMIGVMVIGLCAGFPAAAMAQDPGARPFPPEISVTADATIAAKPDRATIEIGVVTESKTAQAAAAQNAKRVEAVITALRAVLPAVLPAAGGESAHGEPPLPGAATASPAQITTVGYSLDPVYSRPKPGGNPILTSYSVSNTVRATTDDLSSVGPLIDSAMGAGANRINRLAFTLQDEQPLMMKALGQAAARAKEKAEAIASALGVNIVRVLQVEENGPSVRPVEPMLRFNTAAAEVPTPVESGTINISATVTLTVEIGNPNEPGK
jgi:uncharacterized protein YggE